MRKQYLILAAIVCLWCSQGTAQTSTGYSKTSSEYYNMGIAQYNSGQYAGAIAYFDAAIALNQTFKEAYTYRGASKMALARYADAIADYNIAITLDPSQAYVYYNRGSAKLLSASYADALQDFNYTITLDPKYTYAYYNRGLAQLYLGQFNEAIKDFRQTTVLEPSYANAWYNMGLADMQLKQIDEAIANFNHALSLNPNMAMAYNARGYCQYFDGKYMAAVADYDEAVKRGGSTYQPFYKYREDAVSKQNVTPVTTTTTTTTNTTPVVNNDGGRKIYSMLWKSPESKDLKLQKSGSLPVSLLAIANYQLSANDFTVYVNGQSLNGGKARVVDFKQIEEQYQTYSYEFATTLDVPKGINKIKIGCGTTMSSEITVEYAPQQVALHVLSIGTHSNLQYPEKDAQDFANMFANQVGAGKLFSSVDVQTLTGDSATADNIVDKVTTLAGKSFSQGDIILLFISSHGYMSETGPLKLEDSHFSAVKADRTSVDFDEEILGPLRSVDCKKFVFIDACHSGAIAGQNVITGAKADPFEVNNAINKIINAPSEISIMMSCTGSQTSWEDPAWQNGAFTYALREGLQGKASTNDHVVTIEELCEYIKKRVPELTTQAGKPAQQPTWNGKLGDLSLYSN
jgi:tetratricopeptide (TPR) repeat protein